MLIGFSIIIIMKSINLNKNVNPMNYLGQQLFTLIYTFMQ